jgi:hypothetical protein
VTSQVQETIDQALIRPAVPRVFVHSGCGGWVLFDVRGGWCLSCSARPVPAGDYAKPGAEMSRETAA